MVGRCLVLPFSLQVDRINSILHFEPTPRIRLTVSLLPESIQQMVFLLQAMKPTTETSPVARAAIILVQRLNHSSAAEPLAQE